DTATTNIYTFPTRRSSDLNYLSSLITINAREQKLGDVLERISSIGGFYFSYSSSAIPKDSLVNVSVNQESVEKILNQLLKGDYRSEEHTSELQSRENLVCR